MKYIQDMENQSSLRTILLEDLKDMGIKPPKSKKHKSRDDGVDNMDQSVFGNSLCNVETVAVHDCGPVPRFLVEATRLLEPHIDTEGLFRKSGSVTRQKELKDRIELGEEVKEAHPLDMCSLVKQFFRELPDPLLTTRLHDTFIKCFTLENENMQVPALLLLSLLLPWQHLSTLRFFMKFLARVAARAEQNKMDVANLAVCLAPNVLHCNNKTEKMNITESKMLQAQTNIVEILIINAENIGMVCPRLCDRANLYSSCFPSEDELERSSETTQEDGKTGKKKKRRSGSLQGLVNNLSNSFQKWRRDSKGNTSSVSDKSSMISYMSDTIDASSCDGNELGSEDNSPDYPTSFPPDFTPKVMRKRKASSEMIPFSASKKKAILQQMPQMSTLGGTPFTPHVKGKGRPQDMSLGTPCIKFADGQQMVFNAETPMQTPRRKMERFLSPTSGTKVKRQPSGKSSCFNQKTPKTKRRSVKGFFRRLSGGKDPQPGGSNSDLSESATSLGDISGPPNRLIVMEPASLRKKSGLFRRHRKTPSSPARLVHDRNVSSSAESSSSQDEALLRNQESITNLALAAKLKSDLITDPDATPISRPHKRGYSGDGSFGNGGLRRGRPNTVASGLPPDKYKPSPNRSRRSMDAQMDACLASGGPTPIRQSSQKEIFVSPERHERLECDPGAFDTSPIPLAEPLVHDIDDDLDDDDEESEDGDADSEDSIVSSELSRHSSVRSLAHEDSVAPENHTVMESEHDQAFINESMLISDAVDEVPSKIIGIADTSKSSEFKAPSGLPMAKRKEEPSCDLDKLNASVSSDVSDTSVCTVIFNGQPISSKHPLPLRREPPVGAPSTDSRSVSGNYSACGELRSKLNQHQRMDSIESTDSAVDCSDSTASQMLPKSESMNSLLSVDSGMGPETLKTLNLQSQVNSPEAALETRPECEGEARDTCTGAQSTRPISRSVPVLRPMDKPVVSRHASFNTLKEGNKSISLQKRADACDPKRRVSAEPKLQISSDMHHMLERAGVVSESSRRSRAPFVTMPLKVDSAVEGQNHSGKPPLPRENGADVQDTKSGNVAASVKQIDASQKEVLDRHTSPLRFANSVQRRGVSPVRIPTIFAKADQEAAKYREMALTSLKASPKPAKARANLPISTNLVRNTAVESARHRLASINSEMEDESGLNTLSGHQHLNQPQTPKCSRELDLQVGHTPPVQLQNPVFQSIDINESLLETINDVCTPKSERASERESRLRKSPSKDKTGDSAGADQVVVPKIKPNLIAGSMKRRITVKTGLGLPGQKGDYVPSRCRSPVKPVKRLHGSTSRSPRSPLSPRNIANRSPRRFRTTPPVRKATSSISPIPQHVTDWDM